MRSVPSRGSASTPSNRSRRSRDDDDDDDDDDAAAAAWRETRWARTRGGARHLAAAAADMVPTEVMNSETSNRAASAAAQREGRNLTMPGTNRGDGAATTR
eukprot:31318-Pelagococcus_subviridis.AAC.7